MAGQVSPIPTRMSPTEARLAVHVARLYFLDDMPKNAIAVQLGLSRFKVARLIDRARAEGLVTITFASPDGIDRQLSARLAATLGLETVLVADPVHPSVAVAAAAETAVSHLAAVTTEDSVLGLTWSRSAGFITEQLEALPPCTVVQLLGVLPRPDQEEQSLDLVRRAARACGGTPVTFYAPLLVPDASTATNLRATGGIADAVATFDRVTTAVLAVGHWRPGSSTVFDHLDRHEADTLTRRGAVAETSGLLIDADGNVLPDALQDRTIAISEAQLRAVPEVVGVATEPERAPAIRALARSGLIHTLVTHRAVAERLLGA